MNRWLCFFYTGNENDVCVIDFATLGASPQDFDDEIKDALQEAGLSIDAPCLNGFFDISDINDDALTCVVGGITCTQLKTVRIA